MKKHFLVLLMMLSPLMAMAYDAEIDGIYYNFNGSEATVTSGDNKYAGDVVIPESVTYNETEYSVIEIGVNAFYYCRGLTSITIPNSVECIDGQAFYGCDGLTTIMVDGGNDYYASEDGILFDKDKTELMKYPEAKSETDYIIPNSVTSIGSSAFLFCISLTSITIPNSVTSIGSSAFSGCSGLTTITIPNSVTSIGEGTFNSCSGLTSITIPNSVTSIGSWAFEGCSGLTSVTIGNSVTSIGNSAFSGCSGLTTITIPNSVTSIGESTFYSCGSLTSITIPNSVTSIGKSALSNCSSLATIVVEDGNTKYDSRNNCNALIEMSSNTLVAGCKGSIIPNSVTTIGNNAFVGCSGLTSITIPNSVTSIGNSAFENCSGLTSIEIPNSVTTIGNGALGGCSGLTSITIPNSVTSIGESTFYSCSSLTSITIPNSVTSIGAYAFYGCSGLTSITIPNNVTCIEFRAFADCGGLTDVYCYAENVPTTDLIAFDGTPIGNITLHVPEVSIDAYKTTIPWSDFKEIVKSDFLDVADMNINAGESQTQTIGLTNEITNFVAFQMDLTLPGGISIDKTDCTLSDRITDEDQVLTIGKLESGAYRITSTSLSLAPINGNEGTLLNLKLTSEDGSIGGQATISNITFSTAESEKVIMSDKVFDISILYKVVYKVDNEVYQTDEYVYNAPLTLIDEPTKEGYTFSGWSEIPETMPAHDVTVTGTFSINKYKLIYLVDGEEYKTYEVEYGTAITPEADPKKEGYTFSGWSEIPATMPAHDVTVTGTFSINKYKLIYKVDGEEYKTYEVEYGAAISPETEPTKEGYTFSGWSEIPETMPNHDVEITGRFYLYGDVNTDEGVDVVDVVDIARFVVATPSVNFREKLADLNFDNTVNIADAVTLVNYIAGDQNFARAMTSYDYDQCQLQLVSAQENALSLYLAGDADLTAFQFEMELSESTYITAMRINGQRMDGHQLLYNKVGDNRYRVAVLSLSNAVFKGSEGELLNISIEGLPTDEISIHNILFVTKNGTGISFDDISLSEVTGIMDVVMKENIVRIYSPNGKVLDRLQKGLNIVLMKDGTIKKIVVK